MNGRATNLAACIRDNVVVRESPIFVQGHLDNVGHLACELAALGCQEIRQPPSVMMPFRHLYILSG